MDEQKRAAFQQLLSRNATAMQWMDPQFASREQSLWLKRYQAFLVAQYGDADFAGVADADQQTPMALASIFVPEHFSTTDLGTREVDASVQTEIEDLLIQFDAAGVPQSVGGHAVLVGAPGSGKSSLVRVLAVSCAQTTRNALNQHFGRRLVIPFILRELDLQGVMSTDDLLAAWCSQVGRQSEQPDLVQLDYVRDYLQHGWAVVAFDGVDEVGPRYRRRLRRLVYALAARYPNVAIFVTGRPVGFERLPFDAPKPRLWRAIAQREGWPDNAVLPHTFAKQYLAPFNDAQIEAYIRRWYQARYPKNPVKQREERALLLSALQRFSGLQQLKRRPIYLACLTYVHDVKRKLPNSHVLAYRLMIEAYVDILDAAKRLDTKETAVVVPEFDITDKWRVLEWLAYGLHSKQLGEVSKEQDQPFHLSIARLSLIDALTTWIKQGKQYPASELSCDALKLSVKDVPALVGYFIARSGLLVEPEEGRIQFSHLSFQEVLAGFWVFREMGNHAFDLMPFLTECLLDHLAEPSWHPVGLAFFGFQTLQQGGNFQQKLLDNTWLQEAVNTHPETDHARFQFIGRLLGEGEPSFPPDFRKKLWFHYWQLALQDEDNVDWLQPVSDVCALWPEWESMIGVELSQQITGDTGAWALTLLSALPVAWLQKMWQSMGVAGMRERWGTQMKAESALMYALDVHAQAESVRLFLQPYIRLDTVYALGQSGRLLYPVYQLRQETWERDGFLIMLGAEVVVYSQREGAKSLALALDRARVRARARARSRARDLARDLARARARDLARARAWAWAWAWDLDLDRAWAWDLDLAQALALTLASRKILSVDPVARWLLQQTTARCSHHYFATPSAALTAMTAFAEQHPAFKALFRHNWFPYQALKQINQVDYVVEPIEAGSHRLYRYLRHELEKNGDDIKVLPPYLALKPGDAYLKWHGDAAAKDYLAKLKAAGWDVANEVWPPEDVDAWVSGSFAIGAG